MEQIGHPFQFLSNSIDHFRHFPFTVDTRDALYTPLRLIIIEPSFIHILSRIFELDATGLNNDRCFPFFFFLFSFRNDESDWWYSLQLTFPMIWFKRIEIKCHFRELGIFFFGFSNRWFSKIIILASRIARISLVWNSPWKIF